LRRIFLLSPANAGGKRASMLLNERAAFPLAQRFRLEGATLGEAFQFMSGLYFRGKLAYAERFAPETSYVITGGRGLVRPGVLISPSDLREIGEVPIDLEEPRYRVPLERDARELCSQGCEVVLLGSVATPKYVEPLLEIFGERLLFPQDFAGRGDMSRGGLLLRCVQSGTELGYVPVLTAMRHGPRPAKLERMPPR
jgi:hypothetical protein